MTGRTTRSDAGMVHGSATFEAGGALMTGFTGRSGGNVGAGFRHRFNTGIAGAVMAGRAACGNTSVVHRGASKAGRRFVAGFTRGGGRNMVSRFG